MIDAPPFTDPANTEHDAAVMRDMIGRMRVFARGWLESPPPGPGALCGSPTQPGTAPGFASPTATRFSQPASPTATPLDARQPGAVAAAIGRARVRCDA